MITTISGALASLGEDRAIIKIDDKFSYEVLLPRFMIRRLFGKIGQPVEFHTYHYLEGGHGGANLIPRLVGFPSSEEREFFEKFITVPDIGVRKALRCFVIPISEIAAAIENGDTKTLESLPGVGKRSAQKIVAELGGKVAKFALIRAGEGAAEQGATPIGMKEEVSEVMLQLGYNPREAQDMIARALKTAPEINTAEDLLAAVYRQRAKEGM